jgi:L-aminopeptidase/D-esterase-like protein
VGVLAQCNQGARRDLRIAGVPVGEMMPEPTACYADRDVPSEDRRAGVPFCDEAGSDVPDGRAEPIPEGAGSIIIVLATDAPVLPTQLKRLVTRTALGLARIGGMGRSEVVPLEMLPNDGINSLIAATVHATEEAILNAMLAAETLTGINGYTVPALPQDRLRGIMERVTPTFRNPS